MVGKIRTQLVASILVVLSSVLASPALSATKEVGHPFKKVTNNSDSATYDGRLPDFKKFKSVTRKKRAFFAYMRHFSTLANDHILAQRNRLIDLRKTYIKNDKLSKSEKSFVSHMASQYKLDAWDIAKKADWRKLLLRVDIIPSSLLLAQSAKESAWGTSRFAREGNNMFGQWCFIPHCGIVPKKRGADKTHEVQKFPSVLDSVKAYIFNLNTNSNYHEFRLKRGMLRANNQLLSGLVLAEGLRNYSQRRGSYVMEIKKFISSNHLE